MDRILILMSATEYADAQPALQSARENAAAPDMLSWGLCLSVEPDDDALADMSRLGLIQFLCPGEDLWAAMPSLWQGEGYVLLAHPSMRFTKAWDRELLKELRACPRGQVLKNVLTGYLPVREDPLGAVCPVGADAFDAEGTLSFRHGTPLRFAAKPERGPFLHPDFCFAPAGFFRAMANTDDEPLFMRAFRDEWDLYTLHKPLITLVWDLPVPDCSIPAGHDLQEAFADVYGVSFAGRTLSPQSRRGMLSEELDIRLRVPAPVKLREKLRKWKQDLQQKQGTLPNPLCVTLYTSFMDEEALRWLKQLAGLKNLPLLAYAEPLLLRQIAEFLPNVCEFKTRYAMELPIDAPELILPLSKAAILGKARDRHLTHSHYIWLDADCVQYPVYPGTVFDWSALCTDRIVMSMVNGVPDTTMFAVPENMVLNLARDLEARCLAIVGQRGTLPTETELWEMLIRENPDWFQLVAMPVRNQLFTLLNETQP
ncbi:MAG: hypothetical protein IJZ74_04060 [Clostridia bacterium]|nr:hypothetical protein [Clostridia bacterium]